MEQINGILKPIDYPWQRIPSAQIGNDTRRNLLCTPIGNFISDKYNNGNFKVSYIHSLLNGVHMEETMVNTIEEVHSWINKTYARRFRSLFIEGNFNGRGIGDAQPNLIP